MKGIPIIIPSYNQLTYLRNLINWWHFYYPENEIIILDNGSDYGPLLQYYKDFDTTISATIIMYSENICAKNLKEFIETSIKGKYDYYVISDPDIMPHPNTPPNFLEIWKGFIDKGYHRVGFNLITDNLPNWLNEKEMIVGNENELLRNPVEEYNRHIGFLAPIDTTFAMYSTKNSGWSSPMNSRDWSNSLRIFDAFHLGWYQHTDYVNPEMDHYYRTAKYRVPGEASAGKNNNRPKKFMPQ